MFEDGNAIVNVYAADARKLSSYYIAQVTQSVAPKEGATEKLLEKKMDAPQKTPTIEEPHGTHYIGNFEYLFEGEQIDKVRIHNAEGYVENRHYFYYRKDHLGNNREVWNASTRQTEQVTNYYPTGLPWSETRILQINANTQPYLYNGKEFVEYYGYDVFDYGFRGY